MTGRMKGNLENLNLQRRKIDTSARKGKGIFQSTKYWLVMLSALSRVILFLLMASSLGAMK